MKPNKTIGTLFVAGAVALFIPYTALTIIFEYPDILRQNTETILTKFHDGGSTLIWTWFAFAMSGTPLLPAYILLGQELEDRALFVRVATNIGIVGLVVQIIGLLRWTFVVPVLANAFVSSGEESTKAAAEIAFQTIHQFGGVMLGEHLGQLFTIVWTILICSTFAKLKLIPTWIIRMGYVSSLIYLMAQTELFATVIPGFPVWDMAGFIGSTLWLLWLILIGIKFIRMNDLHGKHSEKAFPSSLISS